MIESIAKVIVIGGGAEFGDRPPAVPGNLAESLQNALQSSIPSWHCELPAQMLQPIAQRSPENRNDLRVTAFSKGMINILRMQGLVCGDITERRGS
jgi:hypothetical protein